MSQAYLDRSRQNDSNSNNNTPSQQKEDFEAQMKKLDMNINNPGWDTADISPAQMFAEEEEEKQAKANEEELQMKPGEEEELQKKDNPNNPGTKTTMPDDLQSKMENSFGEDFSDVNIHKDSENAPSLSSLAYTQGNDIHFAPGQYDPCSQKGQKLIGHELSHVVQQREGRVKRTNSKQSSFAKASEDEESMPVNSDPTLENEADEMGAKAVKGETTERKSSWNSTNRVEKTIQKTDDDETFVVPKGWGLSKIADHLGVTVEALKEANRDKLKTWGDVQGFNAGVRILIPTNSLKIKKRKSSLERLNELYMLYKERKVDLSDLDQVFSLSIDSNEELKNFGNDLLNRISNSLQFSGNFLLESCLNLKKWINNVLSGQNDTDNKSNKQKNASKDTISTSDCWDSYSNDRIAKIHPKVQPLTYKFINILDKKHCIKVRVTQGLRTYAQQNDLYSKGRDDKGNVTDQSKVVTNAKGGDSFHNFGLAIDVVEINNGKALWSNKNWNLIGKVGKECGFEWGGDWSSFVDKPHFQHTMNKKLSELQKLKNSGKWPV